MVNFKFWSSSNFGQVQISVKFKIGFWSNKTLLILTPSLSVVLVFIRLGSRTMFATWSSSTRRATSTWWWGLMNYKFSFEAFICLICFIRQLCPVSRVVKQVRIKELQRRLDQTLGKPGTYHHGVGEQFTFQIKEHTSMFFDLIITICLSLFVIPQTNYCHQVNN